MMDKEEKRRSELCKAVDLQADWYKRWCKELNEEPKFHRKQWEFIYVMQALWERGCIAKEEMRNDECGTLRVTSEYGMASTRMDTGIIMGFVFLSY